MANILLILLVTCELSVLNLAAEDDLASTPFCGINNTCCKNREDRCSFVVNIPEGNTMCYCDEFCTRPDGRDDCCIDYHSVCGGNTTTFTSTSEPPIETTPSFIETTPTATETTPSPGEYVRGCIPCTEEENEECDKDRCIIESYIIARVNSDESLGWRASNYSQLSDKKLGEGLIYKLGTFERSPMLNRMGAVYYQHNELYLMEFDARVKWPTFISPVADQGWCGSDWAVSLATIISDRFAIQSNGAEKVQLSPQTLLSCNTQRQQGCKGGHIDTAWRFALNHGLVDEDCFPYKGKVTKCPLKPEDNLLADGCRPLVVERSDRYKVGPPYRLAAERDVMYDIIYSGPIQAIMEVYQDFFHYSSGIYRHSKYGDQKLKGYHSVRLIGWGEENGQKYWLVANSWGTDWGEDGYFRIARGVNESGIESFMVSANCDVTESAL